MPPGTHVHIGFHEAARPRDSRIDWQAHDTQSTSHFTRQCGNTEAESRSKQPFYGWVNALQGSFSNSVRSGWLFVRRHTRSRAYLVATTFLIAYVSSLPARCECQYIRTHQGAPFRASTGREWDDLGASELGKGSSKPEKSTTSAASQSFDKGKQQNQKNHLGKTVHKGQDDVSAPQSHKAPSPSIPNTNPPPHSNREAYVTMITTAKYTIGAEVVSKCLKSFGSTRPLVALVDASLPQHVSDRLRAADWQIRIITHVDNPNENLVKTRPWFNTTFSKLHIFGLTEYDTIVFLDADVLITRNIDELFLRPIHDDPSLPFAASPEVLPPNTFNSGVLVVRPNRDVYTSLVKSAGSVASYDGSDQGFLNRYFNGWWNSSAAHRLPFAYNVPQTFATYYRKGWDWVRRRDVAVLHFAGDDSMKPWSFSGVVPPSLAAYLYVWQEIARAPHNANISSLFDVLHDKNDSLDKNDALEGDDDEEKKARDVASLFNARRSVAV